MITCEAPLVDKARGAELFANNDNTNADPCYGQHNPSNV